MIKSTSLSVFIALLLISLRFPIGVAIKYNISGKLVCIIFLLFIIYSCTPPIIANEDIFTKTKDKIEVKTKVTKNNYKKIEQKNKVDNEKSFKDQNDKKLISAIEVILPSYENKEITINFINSLELSLYKKNISNLSFNINTYSNLADLKNIINKKAEPGKIFVGPLTSNDTSVIKDFCNRGVIFFPFASDRKLASDCIYLINFFPEDDLRVLFEYFDSNDRIALLYPENNYGQYVSKIIDEIANNSKSIVVNKVSYKNDLSNAREAIKKLGKYELRRYELERQKKLLQSKNDEISIKALKKIEKFETIGELNFTHVIIADYNISLLQIAPLLPFYDIDPNKIQFVGTGVWDDEAFFDEPSLQKAIFPGILISKRSKFVDDYLSSYKSKPIRTATIMYDLTGLLSYIIEKQFTLKDTFSFLDDQKLTFEGVDGQFVFKNHLIRRNLNILRILDGKTLLVR